ncbi:MAG TPA: imidazolonepropionase [Gemmatimonas aurantiaca]|nr:imidazolonepropionase [Gemmatimonas aurantiaca]HCT57138.1 imidazolonepropionase [Gemmatimonas aurantiaca]
MSPNDMSSGGAPTMLFVNAAQTLTASGPARARRGHEMRDADVRSGVGVAVQGERIVMVDTDDALRRAFADATEVDCDRGLLAPGFVDSHTHTVFGAARYAEQELRATGVPYLEIARRGGGIHSSVRDLRSRTNDELFALAVPRLARLASGGVTTVEIKSGYGLTVADELRTLRVIRDLATSQPLDIVATCLGAHEVPLEFRDRDGGRQEWLALLAEELFPQVAAESLAQFADIFCEPGVFTVDEARVLLQHGQRLGLRAKLHADELHDGGAAGLAAELGAISADHLAAISPEGIAALAASETVATVLPATMLFLGTGRQAPARQLIEAGAAVALATDFNPGTSPLTAFPLVMTLAVSELRLSASEAWIASTVNGAAALGLAGVTGQLSPGFRADLAIHAVEDFRALPYWFGERLCVGSWSRGRACHPMR